MIIDILPSLPESYVMNCLIKCRDHSCDADPMFTVQNGVITVRLDGCAIIPMEEYIQLVQSPVLAP